MSNNFCAALLGLSLLISCARPAGADSPVVIHEWGTLTTWHHPDGTPQGHLNRIDASEVLPPFVHTFEPDQVDEAPERSFLKTPYTPGRPDVTLRLETPVMYFYLEEGRGSRTPFSVEVALRGGVINEFYPDASASVALDVERIDSKTKAGIVREWTGELLDNYALGTIAWSLADLPVEASVPQTEDPIWLAPRGVDSRYVETVAGETEKYLFYRGVAHLEAMLQTRTSSAGVTLLSPARLHWLPDATAVIPKIWLVEIAPQGRVAFRVVPAVTLRRDSPAATINRLLPMESDQFAPENLDQLKASMKEALVAEGLFEREAEAMLATWQRSYFESAGQRIFYIVPAEWLAYHLPVRVSAPHELSRAFIGRIELLGANDPPNQEGP